MISAVPKPRYSMDACRFEIAAMRDRLGLQDKDIYLSIGMPQAQFSKKITGVLEFSVEELGQVADFFSGHLGRALPGWPFVADEACRIIEARVYSVDPPIPPNP